MGLMSPTGVAIGIFDDRVAGSSERVMGLLAPGVPAVRRGASGDHPAPWGAV
jgi:hypothetical protein